MRCPVSNVPGYDELTLEQRPAHTDEGLPAAFDTNRRSSALIAPGARSITIREKKTRTLLRESFREVWQMPAGTDLALERAAFAVGCRKEDVPEDVRGSLQTLTAWVFAMRGLSGSTEHFKELGDRLDPKPKRIEIEGALGMRKMGAGGGLNPDEAAAADSYYATLAGEIVDAEFTKDDSGDLDFLK